jgi:TM2 domain-containing membrane protein YozV
MTQAELPYESQHPTPAIAYLLWCLCFVGLAGIHRFYTGRWLTGLIWVFTWGILGIGQVIDLFLIPGQCERPKW